MADLEEQQLEASLRRQLSLEQQQQMLMHDDDGVGYNVVEEGDDEEDAFGGQSGRGGGVGISAYGEYNEDGGAVSERIRMSLNGEHMHMAAASSSAAAAAASAASAAAASSSASASQQQQQHGGSFKLGEAVVSTRDVLTCIKCDMTNGHVYLGSSGGDVVLFDFTTHRELWRRNVQVEGKSVAISCLDVNGTRLVLGCNDGLTLIYDLQTFQVAQVWKEHKGRVSGVAWVTGVAGEVAHQVFSVAHDGYFLVRDANKDGRVLHSFITCTCPLSAMQVESPTVVYVGSWDGQVKRLDLEKKLVSLVLRASATKESPIRALALAPAPPAAGKTKKKNAAADAPAFVLVVSHGFGEIKSWDMRTGAVHVECYPGCSGGGGDVVNALTVWNGRLYAGGDDRSIRMFDVHTGQVLEVLREGHENAVTALAIAGVTPVITPEQAEEAAAAAAALSHRSSSRARSAKNKEQTPQQGTGTELLLSCSFDCTARAFKLAAVEAGVALRLLKAEEQRALAFDAFVQSKTKPKKAGGKVSRKGSAKGKKKKQGASASGSKTGSSKGSKTTSAAGTARSNTAAEAAKAGKP